MMICGIDIETTGLDINSDSITEVAYVIKKWGEDKPYAAVSEFIVTSREIPEEITKLTGITKEHVAGGIPFEDFLSRLHADIANFGVGYMLAQNGKYFDRPFLERVAKDHKSALPDVPWLDSKWDIDWGNRPASLTYLAADCGFLNPFPHAALMDVMTMFRVVESKDIETLIARASSPDIIVEACVSFDDKDLAKERRYRWQQVNEMTFTKKWVKQIKELDLEAEVQEAPFPVKEIYRAS